MLCTSLQTHSWEFQVCFHDCTLNNSTHTLLEFGSRVGIYIRSTKHLDQPREPSLLPAIISMCPTQGIRPCQVLKCQEVFWVKILWDIIYSKIIYFGSPSMPLRGFVEMWNRVGNIGCSMGRIPGDKNGKKISGSSSQKSGNNVDFSLLTPSYPNVSFFTWKWCLWRKFPVGLPQSLFSAGKSWIWVLKWKITFLMCLDNSQGSFLLL